MKVLIQSLIKITIVSSNIIVKALLKSIKEEIRLSQEAAKIRAAERQENYKPKMMSLHEAKLILNLTEPQHLNKDYIEDKWKRLFEANKKTGSLYLVSKIYVAKERLDMEFKGNNNLLTEKNVNVDTSTNKNSLK